MLSEHVIPIATIAVLGLAAFIGYCIGAITERNRMSEEQDRLAAAVAKEKEQVVNAQAGQKAAEDALAPAEEAKTVAEQALAEEKAGEQALAESLEADDTSVAPE